MKNRVFLGGTCADTTWREELIEELPFKIQFFNPVVENWTPEDQEIEEIEKEMNCNIHLYVITKEMKGVYSIAEVINSSKTEGKLTIFHVIPEGFDDQQLRSFDAVARMVKANGGIAYIDNDLSRTSNLLKLL